MAYEKKKYDSTVNVVGSIPDYRLMIDYIIDILTGAGDNDAFVFRTTKATPLPGSVRL